MMDFRQWEGLVLAEPFRAQLASRSAFDARFTRDSKAIADYWAKHPDEKAVILHPLTRDIMKKRDLIGLVLDNDTGKFALVQSPEIFADATMLVDGVYPDIFGMIELFNSAEAAAKKRLGWVALGAVTALGILGASIFMKQRGRR